MMSRSDSRQNIFPGDKPGSWLFISYQSREGKLCAVARIKKTLGVFAFCETFAFVKIGLAPDPRLVVPAHLGF